MRESGSSLVSCRYLLDYRWYTQLKKYLGITDVYEPSKKEADAGDPSAHPGKIDNASLFDEGAASYSSKQHQQLRQHMSDGLDYTLIDESGWKRLVEAFGVTDGQQPIARRVVEMGQFVKHCRVEVYLLDFQLAENSNVEATKKGWFSKSAPLSEIVEEMRSLFAIAADAETRLWNRFSSDNYELLPKLEQTVQDAGLFAGQLLLIEQKVNGEWQRKGSATNE